MVEMCGIEPHPNEGPLSALIVGEPFIPKLVDAGRFALPSCSCWQSRICAYNHLPVLSFGTSVVNREPEHYDGKWERLIPPTLRLASCLFYFANAATPKVLRIVVGSALIRVGVSPGGQ